jgi:hypothetical protein
MQPASCHVLSELGFLVQGQRPNKFNVLRTLEDISELAELEKDNVKKKAALIKSGLAAKKETAGAKRKGSALEGGKKRPRGADLPEDEDIEYVGKKTALDIPFILWGFSQKVQVAGVRVLASVLFAL